MWRRPSCRRLGEQRDTPGVAWAGELGETPCEVAAGVVRGRVELCRKLAHGKQRSRGNGVFRHHSFGKGTDRLTLNVPILDVAEAVLKLFELPDGALVARPSLSGARQSWVRQVKRAERRPRARRRRSAAR